MVTRDDDDGCKRKRQKIGAGKALQQQEDILFQILIRLRVKSLMRFKLACKPWMSLISDPFFIDSHKRWSKSHLHHRSKSSDPPEIITMRVVMSFSPRYSLTYNPQQYLETNRASVILMDGKGRHKSCFPLFWTEDPNVRFFFGNPTIVHCDGLFLIALLLIGSTDRRLLVCNPATREVVTLPPTTDIPHSKYSGVGIGLDRSTNKYKVVRLFYQPLHVFGIEVITLGAAGNNSSWRQKACPQYHDISLIHSVVTVEGAAYWIISFKKYSHNSSISNTAILRFNLSNEEFTVVDAPDPNKVLHLTKLQGQLCCYGHDAPYEDPTPYEAPTIPDPTIWVWLLNDVDNLAGWTLRHTIHLRGQLPPPNIHFSFVPIAIDQEGCLLFKFHQHMHCYNPRINEFYRMDDAYSPEIAAPFCCHTTSYVETIMPISSDQ